VERERTSGAMEEFTAFHGASLRQRFKRQSTSYGRAQRTLVYEAER
jgi:hypothetical protein